MDREHALHVLNTMYRSIKWVAQGARGGDLDLTPPQFWALESLLNGAMRASDLADSMKVARSTMTATVDGLVRRGYVARGPDPRDRRSVILQLTDEGRHAHALWRERIADATVRLLDQLAPAEREALDAGLEGLQRVIGPPAPRDQSLCAPPSPTKMPREEER